MGNFSILNPRLSGVSIPPKGTPIKALQSSYNMPINGLLKNLGVVILLINNMYKEVTCEHTLSQIPKDYSGYIENTITLEDDESIKVFGSVENGIPTGTWLYSYKDKLISSICYTHGYPQTLISYYPNGIEHMHIPLQKNDDTNVDIQGAVIQRYNTGIVRKISTFNNNNRDGVRHYYDETGNHIGEGYWKNKKKQGLQYLFSPKTKETITIAKYEDDILVDGKYFLVNQEHIQTLEAEHLRYSKESKNLLIRTGYRQYGYPEGIPLLEPFGSKIFILPAPMIEKNTDKEPPTYCYIEKNRNKNFFLAVV